MARIFIDGFESGSYDLWDGNYLPTVSSGITGMNGTYCLDLTLGGRYVSKTITEVSTLYGAFLIKPGADAGTFFQTLNGAQFMVKFYKNATTNYISAYVDSSLVQIGTIPFNTNSVYLFEFYIYIDDVAGRITTKINGITDIDFTGDTKPSTQTTISQTQLIGGFVGVGYFDNFILDDADWIGDTKIQAIYPTGAGTTTAWTPSAGSNYACVDEIPPVDTDWVETNTINLTDTYATSNLTGTIDNIKCVQVQARSIKEGAPTPLNVDLVVRSGGTDYPSSDKAVQSTFYMGEFAIWETDPATAAAWTESGVNAAEIGIKSKT